MRKILLASFLSLQLFATDLIPQGSAQILMVLADDFNSTTALMQAYEKHANRWQRHGAALKVNLGRNGLGWGIGLIDFTPAALEPRKQEGDGKAPAGLFRLGHLFGYEKDTFRFPYDALEKDDVCVDDIMSKDYNQRLRTRRTEQYQSFERMRRNDDLYKLGIVVEHNPQNVAKKGSCIFIHVQKSINSPTSGCTSMDERELYRLMHWLEPAKSPLLLQLPRSALNKALKSQFNIEE